ncbi:MAG: tetratricopeptide repeat protein [Deltaproteobacteria bacterium]|nr:tetratricopeptide repeat protein [Deltaproteobacteria bacterium]
MSDIGDMSRSSEHSTVTPDSPQIPIIYWLLPGIVAAAVYANTTGMDFVWDDFYLILEDHTVKSFNYLNTIFTSDFFGHQEWDLAYGYYRPLVSLTYLFDYAIWQRDPFGYHLTNIVLHVAATFLVAVVLVELRVSQNAAWWAALVFAVHPIHTENVAWISGRTDVLAFVLGMLAMWAHFRSFKSKYMLLLRIAAALAFFAALLAKEPAVVVIIWIAIAGLQMEKQGRTRVFLPLLPYAAMIAMYLILRFVIADVSGPYQRTDVSLLAKLATAPFTIVRYISWLVLPIDQSAYVQNPFITGISDVRLYVGTVALLGLSYGAYRLSKRIAAARPFVWMTLVAMLPIAGVLSASGPADMGAVMAERFLYFPSFPFIALSIIAVTETFKRKSAPVMVRRFLPVLAGMFIVIPGVKTAVRNQDWKNNEVFYSTTLESVSAPLIYGNLATHYIHTQQWDKAEQALAEVQKFNTDDYHILSSRALLHVARREYEKAIVYQRKVAAKARRGRAVAYNNLAFLYRATGDYKRAENLLNEILLNKAGYADVYFNLAEVYRATARFDQARKAYEEALRRRPDNLQMAAALAGMLIERDEFPDALSVLETQLIMYPNDPGLLNNLGVVYKRMHYQEKARAALERAVKTDPAYARARLNLAGVLNELGDRDGANFHLKYLIEKMPQSKEAAKAKALLNGMP